MMNQTLQSFFQQFSPIIFKKGDVIIRNDETPHGIYLIETGFVKMGVYLPNGREITFNIFKPGSFFSLIWAIAEIDNRYYFQALTDCTVRRAPKKDVLDFIKNDASILFDLSKRILSGLDGILINTEFMLLGDAYNRILATIFLCAKRFGVKKGSTITILDPQLTHQDIANLAGITRETTSATISLLEKDGLISFAHHTITILDVEKTENRLLYDKTSTPSSDLL